jgi:hypothetical protein
VIVTTARQDNLRIRNEHFRTELRATSRDKIWPCSFLLGAGDSEGVESTPVADRSQSPEWAKAPSRNYCLSSSPHCCRSMCRRLGFLSRRIEAPYRRILATRPPPIPFRLPHASAKCLMIRLPLWESKPKNIYAASKGLLLRTS